MYSCHLFLISSASVRCIPFLSFIVPIFAWNVPLVSLIFLKRSLVFLILLFSSICTDCWGRLSYLLLFFGTLHSNGYVFPFLLCFLLLFLSHGLNQILYDYTVEVRNRFNGLDLIDRVPDELRNEVHDIAQETGIKTIPMEKKWKKQNGCLRRPYK